MDSRGDGVGMWAVGAGRPGGGLEGGAGAEAVVEVSDGGEGMEGGHAKPEGGGGGDG